MTFQGDDGIVGDYLRAVRLEEQSCRNEYLEQTLQLASGNKRGLKTRWDEGNASTRIDPGRVAQQAVECIIESFKLVSAMRDELHHVKQKLAQILPRHFSTSSLADPGDPMGEVRSVYETGTKALRSLREGAVMMSRTLNAAVPSKPAVTSLHSILLLMNEEAQKSIDDARRTSSTTSVVPPATSATLKHDAVCVLEWKASSLPQNSPRYPDPRRRVMEAGAPVHPHAVVPSGGNAHQAVGEYAAAVVDQTRQLIECLQTKAVSATPVSAMGPLTTSPRKPQQIVTTPRRADSARAHRQALQHLRKTAEDVSQDVGGW